MLSLPLSLSQSLSLSLLSFVFLLFDRYIQEPERSVTKHGRRPEGQGRKTRQPKVTSAPLIYLLSNQSYRA